MHNMFVQALRRMFGLESTRSADNSRGVPYGDTSDPEVMPGRSECDRGGAHDAECTSMHDRIVTVEDGLMCTIPFEAFGGYPIHPAANLFRMTTADEYAALRDDIRAHGLKQEIVRHNGQVLDGRNRLKICLELGIEPRFKELDPSIDPYAYSRSQNLARRHLSPAERALMAAQEAALERGANQHTAPAAASQDELAKQYGVSADSIGRARKLVTQGSVELVAAVQSGSVALKRGAELAELPHDEQRNALAQPVAPASKRRKAKGRRRQNVAPKTPAEPAALTATETGFRLEVGDGWENQVAAAMADHAGFERALERGLLIVRKKGGENAP